MAATPRSAPLTPGTPIAFTMPNTPRTAQIRAPRLTETMLNAATNLRVALPAALTGQQSQTTIEKLQGVALSIADSASTMGAALPLSLFGTLAEDQIHVSSLVQRALLTNHESVIDNALQNLLADHASSTLRARLAFQDDAFVSKKPRLVSSTSTSPAEASEGGKPHIREYASCFTPNRLDISRDMGRVVEGVLAAVQGSPKMAVSSPRFAVIHVSC